MKEKEELKLFEVSGRRMTDEYPELAETVEFKGLSDRELKFVWYYSNSTSPLVHEEPKRRLRNSLSIAYGTFINRDELKDVKKGKFSVELQVAMDRMSSYDMSYRLKAKLNDQHIFDNLTLITSMSKSDLLELEPDDRKKYSELCIKVSSEMPDLIQRIEAGYGIKTVISNNKKADIKVGVSNIGI